MSALSQSLIDAAADGIAQAIYPTAHAAGMVNPKAAEKWARAAVASALESLDDEVARRVMANEDPVDLRGLAAEVRGQS